MLTGTNYINEVDHIVKTSRGLFPFERKIRLSAKVDTRFASVGRISTFVQTANLYRLCRVQIVMEISLKLTAEPDQLRQMREQMQAYEAQMKDIEFRLQAKLTEQAKDLISLRNQLQLVCIPGQPGTYHHRLY